MKRNGSHPLHLSSPARATAIEVLAEMREQGTWAREALDQALNRRELSSRDRRLATELAYGVVRQRITLDHLLESASGRRCGHIQPPVLDVLRLGLYQVLYLERVPPAAAVHETVSLARSLAGKKAAGFANAVLRSLLRMVVIPEQNEPMPGDPRFILPCPAGRCVRFNRPLFPSPDEDSAGHLALTQGHPRWLVERWIQRFGRDVAEHICRSNNETPPLCIRWRGSQDIPPSFQPVPDLPGMFIIPHAGRVTDLPGFAEGRLVVQGPASARSVQALQVRPGMEILDVCAAPGVKTVHLADLTGPTGRVVGVDNSFQRLGKLKENMTRLRIMNVSSLVADATQLGSWLRRRFSRILVDVPCSNSGELTRRVEARHRLRPGDLEALMGLQSRVLESASQLLMPSGVMVYSTCSIEEEECPGIVQSFLARNPAFDLDGEQWFFPHDHAGVGGYAARIVRKTGGKP
ncbi:MAG: methyltransferase domain-containing protein [Planctomycetes bacterium]|nr:methyltransferase domain-containing protein [Planctomycetota bacterium]